MKFYAVIGRNGVAVMDSWEKAQAIKRYIKKATVRSFETFEEAEDWTLTMFADRFPRVDTPLSLKLNWAEYVKKANFF